MATSFSDMPILSTPSHHHTPSPPFHRRRKSWARRLERCCCTTFSYFPLVFVYGLSSWAVWVEISISTTTGTSTLLSFLEATLALALYILLNVSYTTAVFTSPGSPLDSTHSDGTAGKRARGGYQGLPMYAEDQEHGNHDGTDGELTAVAALADGQQMTTVTAKSTGKQRFCKKCQSVKPDRTHHCSTCGRCVLKMDHHCPWLATCVGLRNYKPFLLFLIYTSAFCWVCFAVSAWFVWDQILATESYAEGFRLVNSVMSSVLGGIIGLVLSGFTGWHLYLACTGQTTIESLEKTRYLTPLRQSMAPSSGAGRHYLDNGSAAADGGDDDQPLSERLKQIHANALPGVLRPEEGETSLLSGTSTPAHASATTASSPAQQSLHRSFASLEAQRERDRYNQYLDEQDSEKLPNAFNLGWKRNLIQVFGEQPLYWALPVCNSLGDGWTWEVSPRWTEARERVRRDREQYDRDHASWTGGSRFEPPRRGVDWRWQPGSGFVNQMQSQTAPPPPPQANGDRWSPSRQINGSAKPPPQPLDRRKGEEGTTNWNDIPEDYLGQANRARAKGD